MKDATQTLNTLEKSAGPHGRATASSRPPSAGAITRVKLSSEAEMPSVPPISSG